MKIIVLTAILMMNFIASGNLRAQLNLLPDSSFEVLKQNPTGSCEVNDPKLFSNLLTHWFNPTFGTPDLFSLLYPSEGFKKLPFCHVLPCGSKQAYYGCLDSTYLLPHSGSNCLHFGFQGIVNLPTNHPQFGKLFYKEFVETKIATIKKNHKYQIAFHYTKPITINLTNELDSLIPLGIYFSESILKIDTPCYAYFECTDFSDNIRPQLEFDSLYYGGDASKPNRIWTRTQKVFRPKSDANYMTLGFFDKVNYYHHLTCASITRIILDDISLIELPSIIGPDSLCEKDDAVYSQNFPNFKYWSLKKDGTDTFSKDSMVFIRGVAGSFTLYAFSEKLLDSLKIFVWNKPTLNYSNYVELCEGDSINVSFQNLNSFKCNWNGIGQNESVTIFKQGVYHYELVNSFGCHYGDFINVSVIDTIKTISLDTSLCLLNGDFTLTIQNADSCWSNPAFGGNCDFVFSKSYNGVIFLKSSNGCISRMKSTINDLCEPIVFIPNALGILEKNKIFRPSVLYGFDTNLSIYNRWGSKIYASDILEWSPTEPGVYVYLIKLFSFDGKEFIYRGTLTVL